MPMHQHHFVKVHGLRAYKCRCGVWYGKHRGAWMMKDFRIQMVGPPPQTTISRGRATWEKICNAFERQPLP